MINDKQNNYGYFFSEKQRLLKQSVKSFADQEIIPIAKRH